VYEGLQSVKEGMKISPTAVALDSLILLAQDQEGVFASGI
jgi:hypothetical protein